MSDIRQALEAIADGVGCEYWLVPDFDVPVVLLAQLGFVKPIFRNAPRCAEHGCRLIAVCDHRGDFDDRSGVANKKAKLTDLGQQARTQPDLVGAQVLRQPLAGRVESALGDGPRTIFALYWDLVDPTAIDAADRPARPAVKVTLDALVAAGRAEWLGGSLTLARVTGTQ